jgi:hypothetical protein
MNLVSGVSDVDSGDMWWCVLYEEVRSMLVLDIGLLRDNNSTFSADTQLYT